jgi:hypothetical protein
MTGGAAVDNFQFRGQRAALLQILHHPDAHLFIPPEDIAKTDEGHFLGKEGGIRKGGLL